MATRRATLAAPLPGVTYYVDAVNGQDVWSGRQSAAVGSPPTDGPWQSLRTVANRTFQPGDQILLKCGQTWYETLTLNSNGASATPITVGTYPAGCANKPTIEGALTVASQSWTLHSGKIYKAQLPLDLLAERPLRLGTNGWLIWSQNNDATIAASTGCGPSVPPCLLAKSGAVGTSILYSYRFSLNPSQTNHLRFASRAPLGVNYKVVVRRGSEPWDVVGAVQTLVGTGAWRWYSIQVVPGTSLETARIDFEIPPGGVEVGIDDLYMDIQNNPLQGAYVTGAVISEAHHPNLGSDPLRPESVYLRAASDSVANVAPGSTYLNIGSDLNVSSVQAGSAQRIRISSRPWRLDERKITGFNGTSYSFDAPTSYPVQAQSGYYLLGSLWMLDEPGEWFYDAATKVFYIWMPDGLAPAKRVLLGVLDTGIDLRGRDNIAVDGLAIRRAGVGVAMAGSSAVQLRNLTIADTAREGIEISNAANGVIEANLIERTGRDAISRSSTVPLPRTMVVQNNVIAGSGVSVASNGRKSLPITSSAAIQAGVQAVVAGNSISRSSYHGIFVNPGSQVNNNLVQESCMLLDDCGGIYIYGPQNNSTVSSNLVLSLTGNATGRPDNKTHTVGIYLDELSSGMTLSGNMVAFADYGIQLHDASMNTLQNNLLYGNRNYQLWNVENTKVVNPAGDVFGNNITSNLFIPTNANPGVFQSTDFATTATFGSFSSNAYSTLLNPYVAREKPPTSDLLYTFQGWQGATYADSPRNLDPTGRQIAQVGYTSFEITGTNIITNGDLSAGLAGWQSWNQLNPQNQMSVETAGSNRWFKFVAGASSSLFFPGNFSVAQGQWYRLTFDMRTRFDNQRVVVGLKRGGGGLNGYEVLTDSAPQYVFGKVGWKRFTLSFKANKTVNYRDPVTGDYGARIDFQQIQPGEEVYLAKVELVPMRPVGTSLRMALLQNPSSAPVSLACPDQTVAPTACAQYVRFTDGQRVNWPYTMPARRIEPIYTRDESLVDSDSDGIADVQDACPVTSLGEATNSRGCAFSQ